MSPALTLFLAVVLAVGTVLALHTRTRRHFPVAPSDPTPATPTTTAHRAPYDADAEHWTEVPWHTPTHRGRPVMHIAGDRSRCDSAVVIADDTARLRVCLDHDRRV